MAENTKNPKTPGDTPGHEPLMNTGPDAIIGYSVETGEPLTKREVFGDADRVGAAPEHIQPGPALVGQGDEPENAPVTAVEELQEDQPPPDRQALLSRETDLYEPNPGSSESGWHSEAVEGQRPDPAPQSRPPTPPDSLDPAENPSLEITDWQMASGGRIPVRPAPEDGTESLSPEERESLEQDQTANPGRK